MRKGLRLGVDLGGTSVKAGLVDERGRLHEKIAVNTVPQPRALVKRLSEAVRPWLNRSVLGTGVGVAGDVDSQKGVVRFSANLGWRRVALAGLFQKFKFPAPIVLDNDANVAAWGGYHLELGARPKSLITLTLGTGVGGGLVLNGELYRGVTGSAGEIGHLVVQEGGDPCACGNRGCSGILPGRRRHGALGTGRLREKKASRGTVGPENFGTARSTTRSRGPRNLRPRRPRVGDRVDKLGEPSEPRHGLVNRRRGPGGQTVFASGLANFEVGCVRNAGDRGSRCGGPGQKSDLGVAGAGLLVI
jgi:hypothetical protein